MTETSPDFNRRITEIREALLAAFGMPVWRTPLPPVDELVSTILSQNTNDINRDKAFDTLKARFPSWEAVMTAEPQKVIEAVRVAGLANQKGPRIQQALMDITEHTGGSLDLEFLRELPVEEAREWLMNIKGVGPKTAAIVLLFSMGIPAFPVDTHIYRVTGRMGLRPMKLNREQTHVYLEERTPPEFFYDLHLNIIRLGREVCGARRWECGRCPVEHLCPFDNKNLPS